MMSLALRAAVVLVVVFGAAAAGVRIRPYDDAELHGFLGPPPGCPVPCFMGIHLGTTTPEQAIALLVKHPWVHPASIDSVVYYLDEAHEPLWYINWRWKSGQPTLPDFLDNQIISRGGVVVSVYARTWKPFGDLWLALGVPSGGGCCNAEAERAKRHLAYYSSLNLSVVTLLREPVRPYSFWRAAVDLRWEAAPGADVGYDYVFPY